VTSKGNCFTAFNIEPAPSPKLVINLGGAGREWQEFIPQCDLTRYCNGTRVYSCKGTTVCQKPDTLEFKPVEPAQRFDHYELVKGEDGKPVELGRGAMGVTYKAFDI